MGSSQTHKFLACWPDCSFLVLVEEELYFRKSELFQRLVAGLCTLQSPLCQEVPKYLTSFD